KTKQFDQIPRWENEKGEEFHRRANLKPVGIGGLRRLLAAVDALAGDLEHRESELLIHHPDIEVNQPRLGIVDADPFHGEPEEELLLRHPGELLDLARGQEAGDVEIVMELVLQLDVARLGEVYLEPPRG
ncbi:unnamed protein product, partial [Linum tenue]